MANGMKEKRQPIPLKKLVSLYVAHRNKDRPIGREVSPKTVAGYLDTVKQFVAWLGRDATTVDMTIVAINEYLSSLLAAHKSPFGVKSRRTQLRVIFRYAKRRGYVSGNPNWIRRIHCQKQYLDGFSVDQMRTLLGTAGRLRRRIPKTGVPQSVFFTSLFLAMWDTGTRVGDMPKIKITDFDPQGRVHVLEHKTGKNEWRSLHPATASSIRECIAARSNQTFKTRSAAHRGKKSEFIWSGYRADTLVKAITRILRLAGLPGSSKYIRRGAASSLDAVHPGLASRFLNHSTPVLFDNHYRVPKICGDNSRIPPAIVECAPPNCEPAVERLQISELPVVLEPLMAAAALPETSVSLIMAPTEFIWPDPDAMRRTISQGRSSATPPPPASRLATWQELPPRRRQVAKLLCDGKLISEIAVELGISRRTAVNHKAMLYKDLGINRLSELFQIAFGSEQLKPTLSIA